MAVIASVSACWVRPRTYVSNHTFTISYQVMQSAYSALGSGGSGRRFGDEERLRMLHRVVGEEVDEVEVGVELLVGGGLEGVVDDAAAVGVALDEEGGSGVG